MEYLLLSFSHKNTNIVDRDSISFKDDKQLDIFMTRAKTYLTEIMILNTCNRVEFFVTTPNIEETTSNLLHDISQHSNIDFARLSKIVRVFERERAIYHLFSVISSLDSLVIGETQIVGQIKEAFRFALDNGFANQKISRAIHYGFKCSAYIRQNTGISRKKVSIASVAVEQAEKIFTNLRGIKATIIGSGEMSRLVAQYLYSKGANITLLNRTLSKAEEIAKEVGDIEIGKFSELKSYINSSPLLFTATSSENPIITNSIVEPKKFKRYWFDLAVPKDIEISEDSNIEIYRVDDLQEIVNSNIEDRTQEIAEAHKIVGEWTSKFFQWVNTLSVEPLIKKIYIKAQNAVSDEVEKAVRKGYIEIEEKENIERIAYQAIKKFLHGTSKRLRKVSDDASVDMLIESLNYLCGLDSQEKISNSYKCEYHKRDKLLDSGSNN